MFPKLDPRPDWWQAADLAAFAGFESNLGNKRQSRDGLDLGRHSLSRLMVAQAAQP